MICCISERYICLECVFYSGFCNWKLKRMPDTINICITLLRHNPTADNLSIGCQGIIVCHPGWKRHSTSIYAYSRKYVYYKIENVQSSLYLKSMYSICDIFWKSAFHYGLYPIKIYLSISDLSISRISWTQIVISILTCMSDLMMIMFQMYISH